MDDDFLKQLRAEPRPAFANDLRKRLARQSRQSGTGNREGELVMTTPNKLPTPSRATGRWRTLGWGMLAVGAASAIFVLGVVLSQTTPQPLATAAIPQPTASAAAFSATPRSADELAAIDLETLVPPILENTTMQVGQVSKRVPDVLRAVPEPVQVRNFSLKQAGFAIGNVAVFLYPTTAERDQAVAQITRRVLVDAVGQVVEFDPDELEPGYPRIAFQPITGVGEQALVRSGRSDTQNVPDAGTNITSDAQMVFVRCGAAVQVRLSSTTPDDLQPSATQIAQALDQQLAPQVCQTP